jgi:hypothetical protein
LKQRQYLAVRGPRRGTKAGWYLHAIDHTRSRGIGERAGFIPQRDAGVLDYWREAIDQHEQKISKTPR